jgi:hypothetical protein
MFIDLSGHGLRLWHLRILGPLAASETELDRRRAEKPRRHVTAKSRMERTMRRFDVLNSVTDATVDLPSNTPARHLRTRAARPIDRERPVWPRAGAST